MKYSRRWNESRSSLFPSLQLFWPQPLIVVGLDAQSHDDRAAAARVSDDVATEFPPLRARGVLNKNALAGAKGYRGWQREQLDMTYADTVVEAKYVGLCESDTLFVTLVTPRALFTEDGRPVVHASLSRSHHHGKWGRVSMGVQYILRRPAAMSCKSYFPVILATEHIAEMRAHVEKVHRKPFLKVFRKLLKKFRYCLLTVMCNYIWHFHRDEYDFHYQSYVMFESGWDTTPQRAEVADFSFLTSQSIKPVVRVSTHLSYSSFGVNYDMPRGRKMIKQGCLGHLKNRYAPDVAGPMLLNGFCYVALAQCRNEAECDQLSAACARIGVAWEKLQVLLFRFEIWQTWEWDSRVLEAQQSFYNGLRLSNYTNWVDYGKHVLSRQHKAAYQQLGIV